MNAATHRRAVALAGASGYSGREFLKWVSRHPYIEVTHEIGRETPLETLTGKVEAAVLATPAEVSLEMTPRLLAQGIKVVDVSGAFRLKNHSYPEWYGFAHPNTQLLQSATYGLYPWTKANPETILVANPGCYTTTALMGLIPLLKDRVISAEVIHIDAASGASGAGKKQAPHLMFSELTGNSYAYKTGKHQHWPELVEYLVALGNVPQVNPILSTKLLPTFRGILATLFLDWHPNLPASAHNVETLRNSFHKYYGNESDVLISENEIQLAQVCDTNKFAVSAHVAYGKPVVYCALDNLVRGAAGQALMNLNQLFGFPAQQGLL